LKFNNIISISVLMVANLVGCSSIQRAVKSETPQVTRYSDRGNLEFESDRKYRRMNRSRFEDEAEVGAQAGSLWVMEGQGAYLFAQNQTRMMGDLLNVRVEGSPKQQLSSKVRVISKLLERLEAPRATNSQSVRAPAVAGPANPAAPPAAGAEGAGIGADAQATQVAGAANEKAGTFDPKDPISTIQTVPTRIVEQLKDGSYRVKGVQPFMIGRREYRVIVTGVVRQEDFDDNGIDASKLLDSQFDIVSSRKGSTL
jgi:flagellar L-ring protein FlgH